MQTQYGNKRRVPRFPGWRHMTASERYNARKDAIFEYARELQAARDESAARELEASRPDLYPA